MHSESALCTCRNPNSEDLEPRIILGLISEASLGNVGQRPGTMGYVDLVITPVGGFGFIILEDILDKYWIRKLEARTSSRNTRGFYRIALNPMRSLANFFRLHHLCDRDSR